MPESTGERTLFQAPLLTEELREFATALDKDRGHDKSRVTEIMRLAADEIERLHKALYEAKTPPAWRGDWGHVG